jgi:D-serine dehydratase
MPIGFTQTSYNASMLARLIDAVPRRWKGSPLGSEISVRDLAASGMPALDGQLAFPLMVLREQALTHNIARMAQFVAGNDVLLAPHAKTTMSPELIAAQIDSGCWAMTAATPWQTQTLRALGVGRIVLANELAEPAAIHWLSDELERDPGFELLCLIDSVTGVELLERELAAAGATRPLPVMLEVGTSDGRAGVRTIAAAREAASAVAQASRLELIGVEFFEGLHIDASDLDATITEVDRQLEDVHSVATQLLEDGLLASAFVSIGGSAMFDRVLVRFPRPEWRVALRSGCYVSHDGGHYDHVSPLAKRGNEPDPLLNAIEVWGVVLSRPEPEVAIVGVGKRDAPYDISPPQAECWRRADGRSGGRLASSAMLRLNDQHATISVPTSAGLDVGDLVMFSISHPCGAFDRWQVIPVVDEAYRVVDAVHTRF